MRGGGGHRPGAEAAERDEATPRRHASRKAADGSRPVTIRDVAALSGVSIATVTRTFQESSRVRPETSARVRESARRLGYRPDSIARTLVTGTSQTVGVLIPSLVEPFWAEIADAIEQRAGMREYSVLLASSRRGPQREREMLEMLFGKRVDGVIVGGLSGEIEHWPSRRPQTPIVLLEWDEVPQWDLMVELSGGPLNSRLRRLPEEKVAGDWLAHVSADDRAGGASIARHLLELGHTRFAFLMCPPVRPYLLRLLGTRIELERAGIELETVIPTMDSFESGRQVAARLLADDSPPTALICGSDAVAVGAIKAAHELGVKVPAEISITGYDDLEFSAYIDPPVTTLRNPMREMGELALDLLLGRESGADGPISRSLAGTLVARGSTGVAPGR